MQKKTIAYFYGSFVSFAVAVPLGYLLAGFPGAWTVMVLAILETSLSFDNAVVNASVLQDWSHPWRMAFLWFGLPIAVFGMRLAFPVIVVSTTTGLGMWQTVDLALYHATDYAKALTAAHDMVSAFGGAFLFMVAFEFFLDEEKDHHWVPAIEPLLAKLGGYQKMLGAGLTLAIMMSISRTLQEPVRQQFIVAGVFGLIGFVAAKFIGQWLSGGDEDVGKKVAQGIGGLLFLEILDASFSFDGVIGAFAITNQLFLIMLGLGVGAMFVRSLTILLVDRGTLTEYRYLEHGAFWAILTLAGIMFASVRFDIPDTVTGLLGAAFIAAAFWGSVIANRREAAAPSSPQAAE